MAKQLFTPDAYMTTVLTSKGKMSDAKSQGDH
jgi:hypothetical protein